MISRKKATLSAINLPLENRDEFAKVLNQQIEFTNRVWRDKNARAFVILTALIIEETIDAILDAWISDYKDLLKASSNELTFGFKISLLRSFNLISPHWLHGADCIRQLRNAFAHEMTIDTLEQLESYYSNNPQKKDHAKSLRKFFCDTTNTNQGNTEKFDFVFKIMSLGIITTLEQEIALVKLYKEKITEDKFVKKIKKEAEEKKAKRD